jgi:hypothetical protein
VRGPAIVPALGCSCSFSSIRSAALDFRMGCLGVPGSLRLMDEVRITSGATEVCVDTSSGGWLRKKRDWCPSDCGERFSVDGEEFEKLDTLARAIGDDRSCAFAAGSSGSNIGHRCTLRRKPCKYRHQSPVIDDKILHDAYFDHAKARETSDVDAQVIYLVLLHPFQHRSTGP